MSVRFHTKGRDVLMHAPQTQWQQARQRGKIYPMETRKAGFWQKVFGR